MSVNEMTGVSALNRVLWFTLACVSLSEPAQFLAHGKLSAGSLGGLHQLLVLRLLSCVGVGGCASKVMVSGLWRGLELGAEL